jgi:PAT family beta-lactamase induction signal transducer AmpG
MQPESLPASPAPAARRVTLAAIAWTGFASGLPLALTGSSLQAWLTAAGIDLAAIGAMSLLGLPYLYKFLWAPLLDRALPATHARRRGWLLLTQGLLACLLWTLAGLEPGQDLGLIVTLVALLAIVSATQDIAVDAYRAEHLTPADRGLGAGISVTAYRLAMITSGAGLLIVADTFGFATGFRGLALLVLVLMLGTWWAPEPRAPALPSGTLAGTFRAALRALLARPEVARLALFVVLYKLGDAFAGALSLSFFLRGQGFSLTEIGAIYKAIGIAASLAGGVAGGLWMQRLGLYRSLLLFGALQAMTNAGFLLLALGERSLAGMIAVVTLENLAGGMGTSALVALLMAMCSREFTATHFAVLSALASTGRVLIGPLAGVAAAQGWPPFFAMSMLLAVPALVLLPRVRGAFARLDQERF